MRLVRDFGRRVLVVVLLAAALEACAGPDDGPDVDEEGAPAPASPDLQVALTLSDVAYAAHEPVLATVTITNVGNRPLALTSWFLPGADLEEPLFQLVRDRGDLAAFVGAHYKRPPAEPADLVTLAAGSTLSTTVDLGQFYDLSVTADYDVRVAIDGGALIGADARGTTLVSNTVRAWIEGRTAPVVRAAHVDTQLGALGFSRCSADQQATAASAVAAASTLSSNALAYLTMKAPSATARYTTWFGAFSVAGWNLARDHFAAIAAAFADQPISIDCRCNKRYYAYVYSSEPYNIYLCRIFWQAPLVGADSQAGTLIHEMSHFDVTASTDDWAYGQSASMRLADQHPERALDNADNHEYFAENAPPLP